MPDVQSNRFVLSVDKILERYRDGERIFAGVELPYQSRRVIENADLSGINLSGADLWGFRFDNAILKDARMRGACLVGSVFNLVDMDGANLSSASLKRVRITSSSMVGVSLSMANLSFAILEDVDLDASLLENCNLTRANLSKIGTRNGTLYKLYQLKADGALL